MIWKLSKSGEDIGSADSGSIVIEPVGATASLYRGCCCGGGNAYGSPAQRKVARRANLTLTLLGAHALVDETDDADEIDEAREQRELLSDTMDSGLEDEEVEEVEELTDGRRLG